MALFGEAVSESKSGLGRSQLVVGRFPLVATLQLDIMRVPQQETSFQELRSELVMSPLNLPSSPL